LLTGSHGHSTGARISNLERCVEVQDWLDGNMLWPWIGMLIAGWTKIWRWRGQKWHIGIVAGPDSGPQVWWQRCVHIHVVVVLRRFRSSHRRPEIRRGSTGGCREGLKAEG
jgi:hypothetical protein